MDVIRFLVNLGAGALDVVQAVLPLIAILMIFQALFLKLPTTYVIKLLKGTALCVFGLWLFLEGVRIGFFPYGEVIGEALGTFSQRWLVIPFGFVLGYLTTLGEPAVRVLCDQVEEASAASIRRSTVLHTICAGVAVFVALGMARIVYGIPLLHILVPGYALAIAAIWLTKKEFVAIAVDAGGVATGPMANTFLLALGLGLSAAMGGQDQLVFGLGLVALIALAPIISVMTLGLIIRVKIRNRG